MTTHSTTSTGELANEKRGQTEGENSGENLHPLLMENVVEKILADLDLNSLKSARQVNKLWNSEGISILFKRFFIRLPRNFHSNKNQDELIKIGETFLSHKENKVPHLSIHCEKDVAVFKSFGIFDEEGASKVESLRWRFYNDDDLRKYRLVDDVAQGADQDRESVILLKELLYELPNLTFLDTSSCLDISYGLQKVVLDFCIAKKKEELKNQKPFVFSQFSLTVDFSELKLIENLEQFAQCQGVKIQDFEVSFLWILCFNPQPQILNLSHIQNRIIKIINDILWRNQENLVTLRFMNWPLFLPQLHFPVMKKLEKFDLWFFSKKASPEVDFAHAFHPSFKFKEATPNLQKFSLTWSGDEDENQGNDPVDVWTLLFESTGPAPFVRKLDYQDNSSRNNIDQVLHTFPNLEELNICDQVGKIGDFESLCKIGTNLKHLSFKVTLNSTTFQISRLDRIFTGFDQETVDIIRNSEDIQNVEKFRVYPSFLDLKGLKGLEIKFLGVEDFPPDFLSVTGQYAFKLMPNVEIRISLNGKTTETNGAPAAEKISQLSNVTIE